MGSNRSFIASEIGVPENENMKIVAKSNELELVGENITIRKSGLGNALATGLNGDRTIAISSITAIHMKLAGWTPGYIQFSYAGGKPFNGGLLEATHDPDALIFGKESNDEIETVKAKIEQIMHDLRKGTKSTSGGLADELRKLGELKAQGVLSEAEFEAAKKKIIG